MSKDSAPHSPPPHSVSLKQLLRRNDLWRGHSQTFVPQAHWSSGHSELDQALLHNGWPLSTLIEVCQVRNTQAEWLLLGPCIRQICAQSGYAVLLNPPSQPYVPGLIQQKINLDQLILVNAHTKADFIASLIEIMRASVCRLLLSWEPAQALNYAELRKCQLAATNHPGLCIVFRKERQQQQSSPASLRLSSWLEDESLKLRLFKQRGKLHNLLVQIPLPHNWQALPWHQQLGQELGQEEPIKHGAKLLTFGNAPADREPKP